MLGIVNGDKVVFKPLLFAVIGWLVVVLILSTIVISFVWLGLIVSSSFCKSWEHLSLSVIG